MKKITKLEYVAVCLVLVFGLCSIAYNMIGSYVDEQGFLVEPFYLVGIGSFALMIAIVLVLISIAWRLYKYWKGK